MPAVFSTVVFVVSLCAVIAYSTPACDDIKLGKLCTNITPDRIYLDQHRLYVGSANYLYTFDTKGGLLFRESAELSPSDSTRRDCVRDYGTDFCENYITIVQPIPSTAVEVLASGAAFNNTLLVCGTNAFMPKCSVHNRDNISDWFNLSSSTDVGFSPYSPNRQNVGLMISNGSFFSATVFDPISSSQLKIAVAPNVLLGENTFVAATSDNDPLYLNLGRTEFISLYEIGDYVFLFAREVAIETDDSVLYSRIFRICKTDNGTVDPVDTQPIPRFLTFQKVRLTCPQQSTESFVYEYNEITATFVHWPSNPGADPVLYAAFSSAKNGPIGTAICKFDFNTNINAKFETAAYLVRSSGKFVSAQSSPFSCPGSSGRQRLPEQARMYQLIEGEVLPIDDTALYTKQGEVYTKVAVDVFSYDNVFNEAMFVGTDTGELKLVLRETNITNMHVHISTIFSTESPSAITHLMLEKDNSTGIRQLVISTSNMLVDITLGNCPRYTSCVECLESNDLYCVWLDESKMCANKLLVTSTRGATEAIKRPADVAEFCGVTINPSTATTSIVTATPSNQVSVITQIITKTSTILPVCTDTITSSMKPSLSPGGIGTIISSDSIGKVAGSLVGGLLLGIVVGGIVCYIGLALKRSLLAKSTNSSPSHSPTALNTSASIHNHISSQERGVVQYSIPVLLPEKQEEQSDEKYHPPPPSVSPPMIDIELDDEVITDLSPTRINTHQPHGRTLSTRPLMASYSSYSEQDP